MNPWREAVDAALAPDPKLSDREWEFLVDRAHVEELEMGQTEPVLVARIIEEMREVYPNPARGRRRPSEPPMTIQADAPIAELDPRAVATSKLVAITAEADPAVARFRAEILDGELIDQAGAAVAEWTDQASKDERACPMPAEDPERLLWLTARHPARPPSPAWPGRLERLRLLGHELEDRFGWSAQAARLFVLTGAVPFIAPLRARFVQSMGLPAVSRVVLTVDPTMSPVELANQWRRLRGKVRSPKPISAKHLELAVWAADRGRREWLEHDPEDGPRPTWKDLMTTWNREHPEESYTAPTNFSRDVRAAQDRLLNPRTRGD